VGLDRDFEGNFVPQGLAPDIGAYEYIPLNSNINASPTSGLIPLTVNFTGNATGGVPPYSYSWYFGDDTSSTEQNPTHAYSDAGDFIVTLTVTDNENNQDEDSVIINAYAPLEASCAASPTSGEVPLTVNFTGSAAGGVLPYNSYSWDFGDGTSSSELTPTHTYNDAGNYTLTLTVTDSQSNQNSDSLTIIAYATPVDETGPRYETAKKGRCFIAKAAYGSPLHPYVNILQDFRDKYLMPIKLGREIVNFYYKYSPFVADLIAKHTALKFAVRINLLPLVIFSYSMVHFGPIISGIILVSIFVLQVFLVLFLRRKIIKRSRKLL
jgi:chitodextrinase